VPHQSISLTLPRVLMSVWASRSMPNAS
jgi:hypothetical protein